MLTSMNIMFCLCVLSARKSRWDATELTEANWNSSEVKALCEFRNRAELTLTVEDTKITKHDSCLSATR